MTESTSPTDLLDLALATAREAGDLVVGLRAEGVEVAATKSSVIDIVTPADRAAERLVKERLLGARPDDGMVGEEGDALRGTSGVVWIVDPIDGTVNYLYGLPHFAVSIAAEVDGEVVAGVIEVPHRGETYTAVRGGGAVLHTTAGRRDLRCTTGVPLERALVATGFGYFSQRRAHQAEVLRGVLPRVRDIRRGGSACVDLCAVAGGRVDAFYERGNQEWDIAAGGLIVCEAGGRVEGLAGAPAGPELTIAAAPDLFPSLHDLLAAQDPTHD
jgi:myo-inositol-1(or 4)-monophosphatase